MLGPSPGEWASRREGADQDTYPPHHTAQHRVEGIGVPCYPAVWLLGGYPSTPLHERVAWAAWGRTGRVRLPPPAIAGCTSGSHPPTLGQRPPPSVAPPGHAPLRARKGAKAQRAHGARSVRSSRACEPGATVAVASSAPSPPQSRKRDIPRASQCMRGGAPPPLCPRPTALANTRVAVRARTSQRVCMSALLAPGPRPDAAMCGNRDHTCTDARAHPRCRPHPWPSSCPPCARCVQVRCVPRL
eukprot:1546257-Pleurochrysis_carterae.AAC.4